MTSAKNEDLNANVEDLVIKKRSWLSAPPAKRRVLDDIANWHYPGLRFQVFMGIFIGYAGFYLTRNNIPLIAKVIKDQGLIGVVGIGIISNSVLIAYGLSKFLMGTVSDRSNARYFLPIGLALSALTNLAVGFIPIISASVAFFAIVMFINGWFQGMGWPPCGRVLVHWFSTKERGSITAVWNCAHNVGGAGVGLLVNLGLWITAGSWRSAFWLPAIVSLVVALFAFLLIRDRPEALGLPPIEEYRNDPAKVEPNMAEDSKLSYFEIVLKHVVKNKIMVSLALANVFVYALRYGVLTWIPLYLSDVHHFKVQKGVIGFVVYELAGIVGTLLCGFISDWVFKGNRTKTGLLFMVCVGVSLILYWLAPVGAPYWLMLLYVFLIGGFIYGPVMLIGLQALDMSPRHVAGTSAGFTGLFGYVLGATLASTGTGLMIRFLGWNMTFIIFLVFVVAAMLLLALIGPEEKRLIESHRVRSEEQNGN